jgi:hypothetical protein
MMSTGTRRTSRLIMLMTLVVVLSAVALPLLLAQGGFSLRRGNVSSGYAISSGSGLRIAGTGGEVDGSGPLTGDGFSVTGGFWGGVDEPPPYLTPPPPTPTPTLPTPTPPPAGQFRLYLPSTIDQ